MTPVLKYRQRKRKGCDHVRKRIALKFISKERGEKGKINIGWMT
jgi:hypothetical protein